jgi:hypothetical protein
MLKPTRNNGTYKTRVHHHLAFTSMVLYSIVKIIHSTYYHITTEILHIKVKKVSFKLFPCYLRHTIMVNNLMMY